MRYFLVSLYSDQWLSLENKRKFIHGLFENYPDGSPQNLGFINKFSFAMGFKPVTVYIDQNRIGHGPTVPTPDEYMTLSDYLYKIMKTPVASFDVAQFFFPDEEIVHPDPRFSYQTEIMALRWMKFLQKVYPQLKVKIETVEKIPEQSLRDSVFEYFYRWIPDYYCTLEMSIPELLSPSDLEFMVPKLQYLTNQWITIAQFPCKTCAVHSNGKNPYHIEIVFVKDSEQLEEIYRTYGSYVYKV